MYVNCINYSALYLVYFNRNDLKTYCYNEPI